MVTSARLEKSLFKAYEKSCDYYNDNIETIKKNHNKKWIAICGAKVIASENSIGNLLNYLDNNGIPREIALIKFVSG